MTENRRYKDSITVRMQPKGPVAEINFSVTKKGAEKKSTHEKAPAVAYICLTNQAEMVKKIAEQVKLDEKSLMINTAENGNVYCNIKLQGFGHLADAMLKYMIANASKPINMGGLVEFENNTYKDTNGVDHSELVATLLSLHNPIRFTASDYQTASGDTASTVQPQDYQQPQPTMPEFNYEAMTEMSNDAMNQFDDLPF